MFITDSDKESYLLLKDKEDYTVNDMRYILKTGLYKKLPYTTYQFIGQMLISIIHQDTKYFRGSLDEAVILYILPTSLQNEGYRIRRGREELPPKDLGDFIYSYIDVIIKELVVNAHLWLAVKGKGITLARVMFMVIKDLTEYRYKEEVNQFKRYMNVYLAYFINQYYIESVSRGQKYNKVLIMSIYKAYHEPMGSK